VTIWRDGEWIAGDRFEIGAQDRAFTLGDGLFETMLWDGRTVVRLERHLARLRTSAVALGFSLPGALTNIATVLSELAAKNDLGGARGALKLILSPAAPARGLARASDAASLLATAAALAPDPGPPFTLASVDVRRNESAPSARHKTLSYIDQIEARRQARALGADEAVQLNTAGALAGAGAGNLVVVIDGAALTPRVEDGALPGTVRAELLARGLIAERRIAAEAFARVEAMAVTNALVGVHPARAWGERALTVDHPLFQGLRAALT
jgi:branched-subunit amino acid aminotransferase/4-amino-4-deoxychorismate lyase